MIGHYLKSTYTNAAHNKKYLVINLVGLTIALTAVILIALFVRDELSYDKWLPANEHLFTLESTVHNPGTPSTHIGHTPGPLLPSLQANFTNELDAVTRLYRDNTSVRIGEAQYNEAVDYVDAAFFDVFQLPFIVGDGKAVLRDSNSIAISATVARKYFGDADPIGKTFEVNHAPSNSKIDYRVAGVFKDFPHNSHLSSNIIALLVADRYTAWPWVMEDWRSANTHTYIRLNPSVTIESFEKQLDEFSHTLPIRIPEGSSLPDYTLSLINVADIHLYSKAKRPFKQSGDISVVNTFTLIAILIVAMAIINFTNLASAQAIKKSRDVSIRKVLGASRVQLAMQFLFESVLTSLIALLASLALVEFLLPAYNDFLGKNITLILSDSVIGVAILMVFAAVIGVIAGAYPAFVLSSIRPVKALGSSKGSNAGSTKLRQVLLVTQFTISIALIVSTLIIYAQTIYSQNIDAGFTKENRLTLTGAGYNKVAPVSKTLKQELANIPGVLNVGVSNDTFPNNYSNFSDIEFTENSAVRPVSIETMYVGPDFFDVYGVSPIAGRNFSDEFRTDFPVRAPNSDHITRGAIINESLLALSGYGSAEEAIGRQLATGRETVIDITIVGVIKDLYVGSTREETAPQIYFATKGGMDFITLEVEEGFSDRILNEAEAIWIKQLPDVPLIASFTQDTFDALYVADIRRATIFAIFSILSIVISSVGLYGLAAFVAESRTREIGIRKVLGATVFDIVRLLLVQFSKPILMANVVSWPIAYLNMENWLNSFAYRIDMDLAYFLFSGIVTLVIAWSVVAGHAIKVARSNPIKALRVI
jgi:putative ABC transport system permease protein